VAALDDHARCSALVGIFHLRTELAGAEIKLGPDVGVAQLLHHALIVGDAVLLEHGDDDRPGHGLALDLAEELERRKQARNAEANPGCRPGLATEARHEATVAPASADRTETNRTALFVLGVEQQLNLVDRAGVIFETAHDG